MKKLYSIFDCVAELHSPVFQAENDDHAIRMFSQSIDMTHKNDFSLWYLCDFDQDNGKIILGTPRLAMAGKNLASKKEPKT